MFSVRKFSFGLFVCFLFLSFLTWSLRRFLGISFFCFNRRLWLDTQSLVIYMSFSRPTHYSWHSSGISDNIYRDTPHQPGKSAILNSMRQLWKIYHNVQTCITKIRHAFCHSVGKYNLSNKYATISCCWFFSFVMSKIIFIKPISFFNPPPIS